jgi:hypothetical protein
MSRVLLLFGVLVAAIVVGWHLYLVSIAEQRAREMTKTKATTSPSITIDPVRNIVEMALAVPSQPTDSENPWATAGSPLGQTLAAGFIKLVEPVVERELNIQAREKWDLYAMLLPYRVRISMAPASGAVPAQSVPTTPAGKTTEQLAAEEKERKAAELREYVANQNAQLRTQQWDGAEGKIPD